MKFLKRIAYNLFIIQFLKVNSIKNYTMQDIQCPHCNAYNNIREIVTRCVYCKENIFEPPIVKPIKK